VTSNVRATILEFVRRYPAVHAREVERQLGLSDRLATYHLTALERDGLVRSLHEAGFIRYVPAAPRVAAQHWRPLAALRHGPAYKIVMLLLQQTEATAGTIAAMLDQARPSTSYHLGQLKKAGLLKVRDEGRHRHYRLADPHRVRRLVRSAPPLPGTLDSFSRMWDEMFPR
jgi:DNA-binding transcriptional ArsR family regulator